ncbi:phosphohydrolase [Magnetospirillum moscoviense]|uniref:Phosphohydrolase n=1 Tax=Magnetospirillum moscoviense TaxID=1437059 RepID=A0A178M8X6_9PROT|nr:phosphohydrolase [Magnetospirillum moscoviense]
MGEIGDRAWQRMLSGRRLDILNPSPLDIEIEDIALGLSRLARWNGQTHGEHGYSVAQHSILVTELVATNSPDMPVQCLLAGLLHDGPEFVTSDLVTPFKRAVGKGYMELEARMAEAIHTAFGLPAVLPEQWRAAVDSADRLAAFLEAVHLAGFSELEARRLFGWKKSMPAIEIDPWSSAIAREKFLAVFLDLKSGGHHCRKRWESPRRSASGR